MPNMNLKGNVGSSSSSLSSGGPSGGGLPKVVLIILIIVVVLGAAAFVLNKAGIIRLWGKQPVVVTTINTPEPVYDPAADTAGMQPDTSTIVEFAPPPQEQPAPTPAEPVKNEEKFPTVVTAPGSRGKPVLPEVAAVRPAVKKAEIKISESKPLAASIAVSAKGSYTIQVSSWESEEKANIEAGILQKKGLPASVHKTAIIDGTRYRVYVGRFDSHREARSEAEKNKSLIDGEYLVLYLGR